MTTKTKTTVSRVLKIYNADLLALLGESKEKMTEGWNLKQGYIPVIRFVGWRIILMYRVVLTMSEETEDSDDDI